MLIDIPMYNVMCLYNEIVIHCVVLDFHFQAFTIQFACWIKTGQESRDICKHISYQVLRSL